MKLREITQYLESLAPLSTQESYDNSGLIVGDPDELIRGVLVSLDCIEATVDEAIEKGANLIIAHHPIVFKGLKQFNGANYIERTVIKAIRNSIAIYAIHTNFDHYLFGVNREIGERMGLNNLRVLAPKSNVLTKLVFFVPESHSKVVLDAVFEAGAGRIGNYTDCSFQVPGTGTYRPGEHANPYEGNRGEVSRVDELRVEVLVENAHLSRVVRAMKSAHPYEEVAYEMYALSNQNQDMGAGMLGELEVPMEERVFLEKIKTIFRCSVIRHTAFLNRPIQKVAFCGGSGSFLLNDAKRAGADIFITGDYKYHDFFDAENQIVIADIGHFESEQYTSNRLVAILTKKFPKFAVHLTEVNTNPIKYF